MTSRQKDILIVLALANILILCCAAPNLVYYLDLGGVQARSVSIASTYLPTLSPIPPPTPTRPSPTPTRPRPTPTLEAGWRLFSAPQAGFAVALPAGWTGVELDAATLNMNLQRLRQTSPGLETTLRQNGRDWTGAGVKFFGADLTLGTSINIIVKDLPRDKTLDSLVQDNLALLAGRPEIIKPVEHWRTGLDAGEAEEFHFRAPAPKPGIPAVFTSQYLLVHDQEQLVITLTTAPDQEKRYASIFDKIAKSFRWIAP